MIKQKVITNLQNELSALRMSIGRYLVLRKNSNYIQWYRENRPELRKFKNIHKGEDCFIIGNGPSLNKMDLSLLNGHHLIGMNKIYLIFDKQHLDLSYHVAVNPFVIEQGIEPIAKLNCPSFISYRYSKDITHPNVYKIFCSSATWNFNRTILDTISEGYTVTFVALQVAYFMGFSRVFLVGVDHNFSQQGTPNSVQTMEGDDPNHFHPDYFKGMNWHLADLEGNETSYMLAKQYFERDGRKIYDATVGGKLQIFPKIYYHEALEMCGKKTSRPATV